MRKTITAVSILLVMVSCGKIINTDTLPEIAINAVNCVETRGYVKNDTLLDEDTGSLRDIRLSAYNATLSQPFFLDEQFKNTDGSFWTNHRDGVHSPLYWPQNDLVNLLAVSTGPSSPKTVWSLSELSSKVVLNVSPDSMQDDILYATASNCTSYSSPVNMEFHHSQAWLEFQVFAPITELTNFLGVTIDDVYTSGTLTVIDDYVNVHSSWDFSSSAPSEYLVVPDYDAYITSPSSISMSVLVPEQPRCNLSFHFRIGGVEKVFNCALSSSDYWFSSIHYTYKINLIGGEISAVSKSIASDREIKCNVSLTETQW